ncbi:Dabb family protein [Thermomonospora umbrina]|uniref:Stress responsive alpha/beta barrel protein n=1 Tax=Thermomonospora umbrina TaxID=111806 RepID=A0A3D9T5Z1_9ACTN|nr:Dabb family protein [Thermomonospora umbrina]REE99181.1 stress responsive alpha/beta barrel protein [Thermomonospora umbrina]
MSGFRHVALFRWVEGTTTLQQDEVAARLRELPGLIPEIRSYSLGVDAKVNQGAFDFAVVADFDDRDAYLVYRDHPAHRAVVGEVVGPLLAERAAIQYEL